MTSAEVGPSGMAILIGWTRLGAYVAGGWLLAVAANLVLAGLYDVAIRDVVMSLAAFTLARLAEVREEAPAYASERIAERRVAASQPDQHPI